MIQNSQAQGENIYLGKDANEHRKKAGIFYDLCDIMNMEADDFSEPTVLRDPPDWTAKHIAGDRLNEHIQKSEETLVLKFWFSLDP